MKKFFLRFILLSLLCVLCAPMAWGGTCYVLSGTSKWTQGAGSGQKAYELAGPGKTVTYYAWRDWSSVYYHLYVEYSSDNSNWSQAQDNTSVGTSKKQFTCTIPETAKYIRFRFPGGGTLSKYVENVYVARANVVDAPSSVRIDKTSQNQAIYYGDTGETTFDVDCSVAQSPTAVTLTSNDSRFKFVSGTGYIVSNGGLTATITVECSSSVNMKMQYTPTAWGEQAAKVAIKNGSTSAGEISLTGVCISRTPTFAWTVGDEIGVAEQIGNIATSNLSPLTFSSSNETYLKVVDGKLTPQSGSIGQTVTITASHPGDREWAPIIETKEITIVNANTRTITWNQNLRGLTIGDANVTLTASASPEIAGQSIRYVSSNESVVRIVNGNQLQIVGAGSADVTAIADECQDARGYNYRSASRSLWAVVRDPDAPCVGELFSQNDHSDFITSTQEGFYRFEGLLVLEELLNIENLEEPKSLSIEVKRELYGVIAYGNLEIYQYVNNSWGKVLDCSITDNSVWYTYNVALNPAATKVRVRRPDMTAAGGYHYFRNLTIVRDRYIKLSKSSMNFSSKVGQTTTQSFSFDYSNVTGPVTLQVLPAGAPFTLSTDFVDASCGDHGTGKSVTVAYNPTAAESNASYTLRVSDGTTTQDIAITATATVTERSLNWAQAMPSPFYSVQTLELAGTITDIYGGNAGSINYAVKSVSPVEFTSAVSLTANVLSFSAGDMDVNLVASAVPDARYSTPASVEKSLHVQKTPTSVTILPTIDTEINEGDARSSVLFSGWEVRDNVKNQVVPGTMEITAPPTFVYGMRTLTFTFTPDNTDMYVGCTCEVDVMVHGNFVFNGGDAEDPDSWDKGDNWNHTSVPTADDNVEINHDLTITTEVEVRSLTITNGVVRISPTAGVSVGKGGVVGATADNLICLSANTGVQKGQTGYLRVSPEYTGDMPYAAVEMYSVGYYDASSDEENIASWQYVGAPLAEGASQTIKMAYPRAWVYDFNEETGVWASTNRTVPMTPFKGYTTTQKLDPNGQMHTYTGQLVSNQTDVTIPLNYHTTAPDAEDHGFNMLANSFSAPIDITKFETTDFVGSVEKTIYLYNTGSKRDWLALQESNNLISSDLAGTSAGQYIAIPIGSAAALSKMTAGELPNVIVPMQGFRVNATGTGASVRLNYERLVWQGDKANQPMRVAQREANLSTMKVTLSSDGFADHLYLLEGDEFSSEFENGYDAKKLGGGKFQLFANEDSLQLSVDATSSLVGTRIGLHTGDMTDYVLTFSHLGESMMALHDLATDSVMPITEGATYSFTALPNTLSSTRFVIEEYQSDDNWKVTTDLDELSTSHIYQEGNNLILTGVGNATLRLVDASGKLILSQQIANAAMIDLSMLHSGVYVAWVGNETVKVIR